MASWQRRTGRALADEAAKGVLARAEGVAALGARPAAVAAARAVVLLQLALQAHLCACVHGPIMTQPCCPYYSA